MITRIPNPQYYKSPPAPPQISDKDREHARKAALHLQDSFVWNSAAEGSDFWGGVFERLTQIAKDGILKE